MTTSYRAAFIDLDGTLLSPKAQVSERNAACIQALRRQGIPVVIATGRPIESVRQLVGALHKVDPVITLSGSMVHESLFGQPLAAHHIPFETMHSILAYLEQLDGVENILLDEAEGFYALVDNPELDDFVGMYNQAPKLFTYGQIPQSAVLSILVHAKEQRRQVYTQLQEKFADQVHFTYFRQYPWIELSHFHSNKGNALELVCQHLGFKPEEVVAIGDGANDLEMVARAGLGIAMENADAELKVIADRIAPHHAEDGVARILEDIFAIRYDQH